MMEMALIMPIMISLMLGGVDFGMVFSAHATLGKSMRDAARYLGGLPRAVACSPWAITNAKNLAVFGKVSPGQLDSALIPGWETNGGPDNNVNVNCSDPSLIVVSARTPFRLVMLDSVLFRGPIILSAQHEEERIGD